MLKDSHSIERLFNRLFIVTLLGMGCSCYFLLLSLHASLPTQILSLLWLLAVALLIRRYVIQRTIGSLQRLTAQIEAIRNEDYNFEASSHFSHGSLARLHTELTKLGGELKTRKYKTEQNLHIIYNLIENIETPVLIVNQLEQLIHANKAFSLIYGRHWETCRYWKLQRLGLECRHNKWHFSDQQRGHRWQIHSSELSNHNNSHQMLIMADILSATRHAQQQSWQNIIRVLNHEIRNSLSPIISIGQTLTTIANMPERAQNVAGVIVERAQYLQDFVQSYSQLNQPIGVNKTLFPVTQLTHKLSIMFSDIDFHIKGCNSDLYADPGLLEQVLINLIKNAREAHTEGQPEIILEFSNTAYQYDIKIIDNGHGIANPDNLFTPLFTTKENGQGIGLLLSQHIVEKHQGKLQLSNREDQQGAVAVISLPAYQASFKKKKRDAHS
ncbi:MAG: ATP-binding protein [Pseudomonadota bacterium]